MPLLTLSNARDSYSFMKKLVTSNELYLNILKDDYCMAPESIICTLQTMSLDIWIKS